MNNKLYVGNLPYSTDDEALKSLFSECGTVNSSKVIMDRETNRSKGFGFVEMSSEEEANSAMVTLNGKDVEGRQLKVNLAKPRENNNRSFRN